MKNGEVMKRIGKLKGRTAVIVLSSVAALILILAAGIYLYIHSMINKINIVDKAGPQSLEGSFSDSLAYDKEKDETGSERPQITANSNIAVEDMDEKDLLAADMPAASEDEIAAIEEKLQSNLAKSDIKYDKNVLNILLIGSDSRKSGGSGRSDAMILISINKKKKIITATSILRDIYLKIPGRDKSNRINAAFAYGGADLLLDTIKQNFKINVDKYVIIDFFAFIDMVDAVGGVTVDVTKDDIPIINGYVKELNKLTGVDEKCDWLKNDGQLLLNGKQALGYARNRYIGTDFKRTARQRDILKQVFDKVKDLKITKIIELANQILPQVTTNLKESEIFTLLLSLPSYIKYDIKQETIPAAGTYNNVRIRGMAVLSIDFEENINMLHKSLYSDEAD